MRLIDVSVHASGYHPSQDTYLRRYRHGTAVCETDDGAVRHGPFWGWTTDLDADDNAVWIEWLEPGGPRASDPPDDGHPDDCMCWWCMGQPRPVGYTGSPRPHLPENRFRGGAPA